MDFSVLIKRHLAASAHRQIEKRLKHGDTEKSTTTRRVFFPFVVEFSTPAIASASLLDLLHIDLFHYLARFLGTVNIFTLSLCSKGMRTRCLAARGPLCALISPWTVDGKNITITNAYKSAIQSGHVNKLQWLYERWPGYYCMSLIRNYCKSDAWREMGTWIVNRAEMDSWPVYPVRRQMIKSAIDYKRHTVVSAYFTVDFVNEYGRSKLDTIMIEALRSGDLEIIHTVFRTIGQSEGYRARFEAVEARLATDDASRLTRTAAYIELVHPDRAIAVVSESDNIDLMQELLRRGLPISGYTLTNAITEKRATMVRFLLESSHRRYNIRTLVVDNFYSHRNAALQSGCPEILDIMNYTGHISHALFGEDDEKSQELLAHLAVSASVKTLVWFETRVDGDNPGGCLKIGDEQCDRLLRAVVKALESSLIVKEDGFVPFLEWIVKRRTHTTGGVFDVLSDILCSKAMFRTFSWLVTNKLLSDIPKRMSVARRWMSISKPGKGVVVSCGKFISYDTLRNILKMEFDCVFPVEVSQTR